MNPRIVQAKKIQKEIWSLQKKLDLLLLSIFKKELALSSRSDVDYMPTVTISGLQRKYEISFSTAKILFNKLIILEIIRIKAGGRGFEVGSDAIQY